MPDLSREEIGEFVSALGCPSDLSSQFAAAILARSGGGHPKLVHLLGLELQGADWHDPPAMPSKVFLDSAFKPLAKAFSNMWREHVRTPALLLSPNLSLSLLQEAIREDANTPHQLAQLLSAAPLETGAHLPQQLLDQLNSAATLHRARLPW